MFHVECRNRIYYNIDIDIDNVNAKDLELDISHTFVHSVRYVK